MEWNPILKVLYYYRMMNNVEKSISVSTFLPAPFFMSRRKELSCQTRKWGGNAKELLSHNVHLIPLNKYHQLFTFGKVDAEHTVSVLESGNPDH